MNTARLVTAILFLLVFFPAVLQAGVMLLGPLTYEYEVEPGEVIEDNIVIKNPEEVSQEVKVYQRDYFFTWEGYYDYTDPGLLERSNAGWIDITPARLVVSPGQEALVSYKITVPEDLEFTGTYWSMCLLEVVPKTSAESFEATDDDTTLGVSETFRYGIQFVTHGGQGSQELKFLTTKLVKEEGSVFLQLDMKNIGQMWLRAQMYVEIYKPDGSLLDRYEGDGFRLYPETSKRFRANLSEIPPGDYTALVVFDCGDEARFGAKMKLKFD